MNSMSEWTVEDLVMLCEKAYDEAKREALEDIKRILNAYGPSFVLEVINEEIIASSIG